MFELIYIIGVIILSIAYFGYHIYKNTDTHEAIWFGIIIWPVALVGILLLVVIWIITNLKK